MLASECCLCLLQWYNNGTATVHYAVTCSSTIDTLHTLLVRLAAPHSCTRDWYCRSGSATTIALAGSIANTVTAAQHDTGSSVAMQCELLALEVSQLSLMLHIVAVLHVVLVLYRLTALLL
jgi:hypothetical protein